MGHHAQKYCCAEHQIEAHSRPERRELEVRTCNLSSCSNTFEAYQLTQKYCCAEHRVESHRSKRRRSAYDSDNNNDDNDSNDNNNNNNNNDDDNDDRYFQYWLKMK